MSPQPPLSPDLRQAPYLVAAMPGVEAPREAKLSSAGPPDELTLGHIGIATDVSGPERLPDAILVQPYTAEQAVGIEEPSIRTFRLERGEFTPVWNSGVNPVEKFCWTRISRAGVYVPIGLPRDRVLKTLLQHIARARLLADGNDGKRIAAEAREMLAPFLDPENHEAQELRRLLVLAEAQTSAGTTPPLDVKRRHGGHFGTLPLPGDAALAQLRDRVGMLEGLARGLPEEQLFLTPESLDVGDLPWPARPGIRRPQDWIDQGIIRPEVRERIDLNRVAPWLSARDWWMYQHDAGHTGAASGISNLRATSASRLILQSRIAVDGPVITKPSIVGGKVYVGSGRQSGGPGGTLHKIDLLSGVVEGRFPTHGTAFYPSFQGIGGSPAIVDGRAYFTGVHGKVYCVDTATMTPNAPHPPALWETNLKQPDRPHNQPVNNPGADSWSGPLVVNGRVYVGCGEGESLPTYGFVFCLDARTGNVIWLFCTSKFRSRLRPGNDNEPNRIPASVAISNPLPAWATGAGFTIQPDPVTGDPETTRATGCSVWSSCAYDRTLNRIYVGVGNSQYGPGFTGTELPDKQYGSGLLSLDATTGSFRGFFQPDPDDSYWPGDTDVDVPGAPTIFSHGGTRVVAFGSKNGSFFLLDPATMRPLARRQMLPRQGGSGVPGDRGAAIPQVVPTGGHGENAYGIMGTPALHSGLGRLFVGIGGYNGMALDQGAEIDPTRTPFLRAVNWNDLHDAWPTTTGPDGVTRYATTKPPMYTTLEVGLSSPAVVNDIVFVSTNRAGLYAFSAENGVCLWTAPTLPTRQFVLGPAIYGDHVVIGAGPQIFIYTLRARLLWHRPTVERTPDWTGPSPPPEPFGPAPATPNPGPAP
ncbi:MAG: PQQ-binding-like beta-propeller repeat protein [Actinomycetota bacterium]|nr:PQQ-binding-like beta-propeller repeat protein [Actinomycetota bacterium]